MKSMQPYATPVAVRDGKTLSVGAAADAKQSGEAEVVIDLFADRLESDGALHELHVVGSRVTSSASSASTGEASQVVLIGRFDPEDQAQALAALEDAASAT